MSWGPKAPRSRSPFLITGPGGSRSTVAVQGEDLHEIEIRRARPIYVSVDLRPDGGTVYGAEDDATTVGLVNKTADVLRRCRRWPSIIVFNPIAAFVILWVWTTFLAALSASEPAKTHWSAETTLLVAIWLVFLLLLGAAYWISQQRHTMIVCSHRSDAPGYWRRNKDPITVAIIAGVVGAFLGTLITIVVTKALE
jgi:hypothetical protein